jgi:hypothetical protein
MAPAAALLESERVVTAKPFVAAVAPRQKGIVTPDGIRILDVMSLFGCWLTCQVARLSQAVSETVLSNDGRITSMALTANARS